MVKTSRQFAAKTVPNVLILVKKIKMFGRFQVHSIGFGMSIRFQVEGFGSE